MEVFLPIPAFASLIPGLTLEFQRIEQNIFPENHPQRDFFTDEQLWLEVTHDGSNPFCFAEKCYWKMLFLSLASDAQMKLELETDLTTHVICLPHQKTLGRVGIEENVHNEVVGIWLIIEINDEGDVDDDSYDLGFILAPYSRAG